MLKKTLIRSRLQNKLAQLDNICQLCFEKVDNLAECNIDHILPISKGGTNDITNLQLVHITCNRIKGNVDTTTEDGIILVKSKISTMSKLRKRPIIHTNGIKQNSKTARNLLSNQDLYDYLSTCIWCKGVGLVDPYSLKGTKRGACDDCNKFSLYDKKQETN